MNADDFRDYMLSFLFLRYLSDNYEASVQKELGSDYPKLAEDDNRTPLSVWYEQNPDDIEAFEKQMRRKVHYVISSTIKGVSPFSYRDILLCHFVWSFKNVIFVRNSCERKRNTKTA